MRIIPTSRGGVLWRFLLAAVVVIGASAATTAVAGLLQFKQLAADISQGVAIAHARVQIANPGDPQTILIVGSDHRAGTPTSSANTDTMLLVRLNPSSSTINVLSVPRDLEVQLPGVGTAKLNAAYAQGGTGLLIRTMQQQVFPGLHVNHIIDINFGGFIALVNQIGCVYSDVDHRYYNDTNITNYSSINIEAGYQRLCGFRALQFVRFRHTDSDIVRSARQQDFIRWAKDQYGVANLVANRDALLRTFGHHTETDPDLRSVDGLDSLFQLVAFSAGHTIKQITFPYIFQPCGGGGVTATGATVAAPPCYVSAIPAAEQGAFRAFMRATTAKAAAKTAAETAAKAKTAAASVTTSPSSAAGLTPNPTDGRSQASALARAGMPVFYPKLIVANSFYCSSVQANCDGPPNPDSEWTGAYPRAYRIKDRQGISHPAYRMTLVINSALGEYYGVQGTTWQNPPLLVNPAATRYVNGKKLLLYVNGGKLTNVAWRTSQRVYWVSNTLSSDIPNRELVSIAASLTRAGS